MRFLLALSLVLSACADGPQRRVVSLRGFTPAEAHAEEPSFEVDAEPVDALNAAEHPQVIATVQWTEQGDGASQALDRSGGQGLSGATSSLATTGLGLRKATWPLLPLPSFLVRVARKGGKPVGKMKFALVIAGRRFEPEPSEKAVDRTLDALTTSYPALATAGTRPIRDDVRHKAEALPLWTSAARSEADYTGFVSFRLEVDGGDEYRKLIASRNQIQLVVEDEAGTRVTVPFRLERKHGKVKCRDGSHRERGECIPTMESGDADPNGPCMQVTNMPGRLFFRQWWVDTMPVANSDIERTALANDASRPLMMRAQAMKWSGWALLGIGLVGGAITLGNVSAKYGSPASLYAISAFSPTLIGIGLVAGAERVYQKAVREFNRAAEVEGCSVVY